MLMVFVNLWLMMVSNFSKMTFWLFDGCSSFCDAVSSGICRLLTCCVFRVLSNNCKIDEEVAEDRRAPRMVIMRNAASIINSFLLRLIIKKNSWMIRKRNNDSRAVLVPRRLIEMMPATIDEI